MVIGSQTQGEYLVAQVEAWTRVRDLASTALAQAIRDRWVDRQPLRQLLLFTNDRLEAAQLEAVDELERQAELRRQIEDHQARGAAYGWGERTY